MNNFLATQIQITELIVGIVAIAAGLFLLWVVVTDRYGVLSSWYEENKDSKVGFWVISGDAKQFRSWFGVVAVGVVGVGIAAVVAAAA